MIDLEEYSICLPARITTFYEATQTADIRISVQRVYNDNNEVENEGKFQDLLGVPVHSVQGGGWVITMPIKPDDTCMVMFSQVGYDHWLYRNQDEAVKEFGRPASHLFRHFSESDGFCFVGLNPIPKAIPSFSSSASQWRNLANTQVISLNSDGSISITSPTDVTINCDTATINATTEVIIDSPETTITGNLTVDGILTNQSIIFDEHIHPENDGGNTSGPISPI